MKELRIPYGVKEIENQYNDLVDYDTVIIPSSVRIINNSFNNCKCLTNVLFETEIDTSISKNIDMESLCHCGVLQICDSFNGISVNSIDVPYTTRRVVGSFSNCSSLEHLNFGVRNDPLKRHSGFGVRYIERSFDHIGISQLTLPATLETVSSSFKYCSSLRNLLFDVIYLSDRGRLFGIQSISSDSFVDSNLSNIVIPSTAKGINRISFQRDLTNFDFSSVEYIEDTRRIFGNMACVFDDSSEAAVLFIFDDGSTKYNVCYAPGQHKIYMWQTLYDKKIVDSSNIPKWFNEFDGGVKAAKNNIISLVIDGTKCCVFIPPVLEDNQRKTFIDLINYMNDRQSGDNIPNFEIHIFYNNKIYDDVNGDNINLRSFVDFLKIFGICDENDFDFDPNQNSVRTY